MESTLKINNISKTEIKNIIVNIFNGLKPSIFNVVEQELHQSGLTNYDFHNKQIKDLINSAKLNNKDLILSRVSIIKINKINIDVHIQQKEDLTYFYLVGSDLLYYHMYLPKVKQTSKKQKTLNTGTNNSKWFDQNAETLISHIALYFRLLEIMLYKIKIVDEWEIKKSGILGLEVEFEIPDHYKSYKFINEKSINSQTNPIKLSNGLFLYGNNGVNNEKTNLMINFIKNNFSFDDQIYPEIIKTYDLSEFISSIFKYGITSYNFHARILIKNELNLDILIIDPWMSKLPFKIRKSLSINIGTKIGFISRQIKDQKSEGSCVLCVFARLIFIIDSKVSIMKILNEPIPDFYAYLIKLIYNLIK